MKQVIIYKGLPGCGKTTDAKRILKENPGQYKRINKDDIRMMFDDGKWSRDNEKLIVRTRDILIMQALLAGKHVIIDDTNLHPKHEKNIHELVKAHAEVIIKDMTNIPLETCIERDLKRPNSVGEKVIRDMYNHFLKPDTAIKMDDKLPRAIIFDIDGTLAKMNGRSPYDYTAVDTDIPNTNIQHLYWTLRNSGDFKLIIVTGRDGVCERETLEWLERHSIFYDEFHIRPEGNTEKDFVIKRRILDDLITRYNIEAVFDDRDQVVSMWRDSGLTCLQVDYGNF